MAKISPGGKCKKFSSASHTMHRRLHPPLSVARRTFSVAQAKRRLGFKGAHHVFPLWGNGQAALCIVESLREFPNFPVDRRKLPGVPKLPCGSSKASGSSPASLWIVESLREFPKFPCASSKASGNFPNFPVDRGSLVEMFGQSRERAVPREAFTGNL